MAQRALAQPRSFEGKSRDSGRDGGLPRRKEIAGIALLAFGLFFALGLISLQFGTGRLMGPVGRFAAVAIYGLAGLCGYAIAGALIFFPVRTLAGRPVSMGGIEIGGAVVGFISIAVLAQMVAPNYHVAGHGPGGLVGEYLGELSRALLSTVGSLLLFSTGLVVAIVALTPLDARHFISAGGWIGRKLGRSAVLVGGGAVSVARNALPSRDKAADRDREIDSDEDRERGDEGESDGESTRAPTIVDLKRPKKSRRSVAAVVESDTPPAVDPLDQIVDRLDAETGLGAKKGAKEPKKEVETESDRPDTIKTEQPSGMGEGAIAPAVPVAAVAPEADAGPAEKPLIVETRSAPKSGVPAQLSLELPAKKPSRGFIMSGNAGWQLPHIDLLDYDGTVQGELDQGAMYELAAKLESTLGVYGVKGRVKQILPGPVVTMYEFEPVAGTRVSKVSNLADDLAMSLEATRVRIVAPIPGKNAIGVEVPNRTRETVYLKEIIADEAFTKVKSKLTIALGKDIIGRPTAVDLAKMPHLLVAGTTGAGKSVAINSFIVSLLYTATPDEVRLIMIDPKMLELRVYEGIPHLLLPVVTDPKKANLALRWAVEEMERRYELIAASGMRDIAGYNRKVEKILAGQSASDGGGEGGEVVSEMGDITGQTGPNGKLPLEALAEASGEALRKLPYIVVVIDEFADLMMVASKEVETSVARIAQKARAAGIHLLLATQRPSVDVITGLIKANFPSRIAFQVAQKVDSRTILDQQGAEHLLGQGDMLFSDRGAALRRVHGCYVTETEIARVVDSLRAQGKPVYDLDILKPRDDEDGDGGGAPEEDMSDEMYDQAVRLVAETRQASISMVQRRLRVGYNRAARMIERMEREGIVGPAAGPNRREVLISEQ